LGAKKEERTGVPFAKRKDLRPPDRGKTEEKQEEKKEKKRVVKIQRKKTLGEKTFQDPHIPGKRRRTYHSKKKPGKRKSIRKKTEEKPVLERNLNRPSPKRS